MIVPGILSGYGSRMQLHTYMHEMEIDLDVPAAAANSKRRRRRHAAPCAAGEGNI
jgi:hypothetical protein